MRHVSIITSGSTCCAGDLLQDEGNVCPRGLLEFFVALVCFYASIQVVGDIYTELVLIGV